MTPKAAGRLLALPAAAGIGLTAVLLAPTPPTTAPHDAPVAATRDTQTSLAVGYLTSDAAPALAACDPVDPLLARSAIARHSGSIAAFALPAADAWDQAEDGQIWVLAWCANALPSA